MFVRSVVVVVVVVCGGRALFAAEKLWDSLPSAPGFFFFFLAEHSGIFQLAAANILNKFHGGAQHLSSTDSDTGVNRGVENVWPHAHPSTLSLPQAHWCQMHRLERFRQKKWITRGPLSANRQSRNVSGAVKTAGRVLPHHQSNDGIPSDVSS